VCDQRARDRTRVQTGLGGFFFSSDPGWFFGIMMGAWGLCCSSWCRMDEIRYRPIGTIHTPFKARAGMPIQPSGGRGIEGVAELDHEYEEALSDLEGFSHVYLIYHLHESRGYDLKVVPFLDTKKRGLFATRAPRRPNPIGISVVRVTRIEGSRLHFSDVDILDGTPLLDIKPYVREFGADDSLRVGWLEGKSRQARRQRSDSRFKK
jgi:tRNA-Thr(GGU) m(6)t(6)A37 methyltransferase TsaA